MKKVGLASDHAKISVHTVQKAVTMQITPIRLHWL